MQNKPDVIFLDINMPDMDGWGFLKLYSIDIHDNNNKPLIYILSSSVDPNDKSLASISGLVSGFISRPFDMDKLNFLKLLIN